MYFFLFHRLLPPLINVSYTFTLADDKICLKSMQKNMEFAYEMRNFRLWTCKIIGK